MLELARADGFRQAAHVSSKEIAERYFSGRSDGLHPAEGEEFLVAGT